MTISSLGDLAMAFALRQRNTEVKTDIQNLSQELASGITSDISDHLGGSYSRLTSVERDLRVLGGYSITIAEAENYADMVQNRLDQIATLSTDFMGKLLATDASNGTGAQDVIAQEARLNFSTVIDTLNSQSAGRNLFSGDDSNTPAFIGADQILVELDTIVAASLSPADAITAIETWFADPLGFETFAYTGSDTGISPFKMSDTTSVNVDVRGTDPAITDVLKSLAIIAISDSPTLAFSMMEKTQLAEVAALGLVDAQQNVVNVQARVGIAQEQIEGWMLRTQTEQVGMEYAKNALLAVDPYETATRLEAAQFQLQSLYTVTARLSDMSLVNYLR